MKMIKTDTKLLKVPGKDMGFPGEYLRLWATYENGKGITSMKISGFGRDGNGNPTDADCIPHVCDVPKERREDLRARLANMYSLPIKDIGYWR